MPLPRPRAIPPAEPAVAKRPFLRRRGVRLVLWTAVGLHVLVLLVGTYAIAFPNPFRVFREFGSPESHGLNPREVTSPDGVPLWLLTPHDDRERIVLVCHGRSHNRRYMLPLIAALVPHENVAALDFSQHGGRGYGRTSIGWFEEQEIGSALAELERRGYRQVVVYGVSMGGAAALRHLANTPEPNVVGLATDGVFANLGEVLRANARSVFVPGYLASACVWLAGRLVGYDPDAFRPVQDAARIRVPWLILHGETDPLVPVESARRLAAAAGENARLATYPGGHDVPDERAMQRALLSWLREL